MSIYKYTLVKYMKAKSTYIIAVISGVLIGFLLGGFLPFQLINVNSSNAVTNYTLTVVSTIAGVTSFLSIFASVFAGFKAASMYKDEVEDGTFLVILSKPMKRSTIIFNKWLAMQTVIFGWALFTVICWIIGIAAFDKGAKIDGLGLLGVSTVSSQLPKIGGFVLLILFVTALIFSSIALLLSTKLSVSATTGISIALGIIIPITSLVGTFTKKDEYKVLRNGELASQQRAANTLGRASIFPEMKDLSDKLNEFSNVKSVQDIYKLGISTGDSNPYTAAWIVDLNFQISQLSSFAYEQAIPANAKQYAEDSRTTASGAPGQGSGKITKVNDVLTSQAVHDFNASPVVQDLKDLLERYFDSANGLSITMSHAAFAALNKVLQLDSADLSNPLDNVVVSNNDKILLGNIGSSQKAPQWLQNLKANQSSPITPQNIIDLLKFTYDENDKGADFKKLLDYATYEKQGVSIDTPEWVKYQTNKLTKTLVNALIAAKLTLPAGTPETLNINNIIKLFGETIEKMNAPFTSFFVNETNLTSGSKDTLSKEITTGLTFEQAARNVLTAEDQSDNSKTSALSEYTKFLPAKDVDALTQIVATSLDKKLDEVKSVQYVNKNSLLIAYIIIALALVPISYWVVKKQDFR